jgi:hypothetical protein
LGALEKDGGGEFTSGGAGGAVGGGVGARRGKALGFYRGDLTGDVAVTTEIPPSTTTSAGARTTGCRRWTDDPRRAPGQYGVVRCARLREDSEEPRGAAHGEGHASAGHAARERARRRGAVRRRPGLDVLLVPCLSTFFSKNLY